jgi:hypothetical protein
MGKYLSIYMVSLILVFSMNTSCILDQGPVYVNPCPCDLTPFKDCDCDPDKIIEISFKNDIIPYLEKYCVICHGDSCQYVNFKPGKAYENIGRYVNLQNPLGSVIYQAILLEFMPPEGAYSADSILITKDLIPNEQENNKLLEWINQGARNN